MTADITGTIDEYIASLPEDSPGDCLAVNGLLELPDNDNGTGRAA